MSTHLHPTALLPPVPAWAPLPAGSCPAEGVEEEEKEQLELGQRGEGVGRSLDCSCHPLKTQQVLVGVGVSEACLRP